MEKTAMHTFIENHIAQWQVHEFGFVTTSDLFYSPEVRVLCEQNSCGVYGKRWTCPPAVGTYEECTSKIKKFQHVFTFTTKHDLEDSFDFEGMMDGAEEHNRIAHEIAREIKARAQKEGTPLLIFVGGSCTKCEKCTYPEPCRFPDELYPTIESYGIEVNRLAKAANVKYINGANTVTYFGCVIW